MMYNIRSGVIRWKIPGLLSDGNQNVWIFQPLLVEMATWNVWPWKFCSWSWSTTFALVPFDGKYESMYKSFVGIFCQLSLFSRYISQFMATKMLVKVMMYNIYSSAIRWRISDFLSECSSIIYIFRRLLVKISTCKVWPWKFRSRSRNTTFVMVPFEGKYQSL